jgi:hypothetical protein
MNVMVLIRGTIALSRLVIPLVVARLRARRADALADQTFRQQHDRAALADARDDRPPPTPPRANP